MKLTNITLANYSYAQQDVFKTTNMKVELQHEEKSEINRFDEILPVLTGTSPVMSISNTRLWVSSGGEFSSRPLNVT